MVTSGRERVRAHRERLRERGLRPIQIWVPDVSSPGFAREAHRQSLRVATSPGAEEDQAFVDAITDWDELDEPATGGPVAAATWEDEAVDAVMLGEPPVPHPDLDEPGDQVATPEAGPLSQARRLRRGEIWTATGGVYATKPRPVVIVQDDRFDATESVTVCPITTTPIQEPLIRIPVDPAPENGLKRRSYVMIDKITTTRRTKVKGRVGTLSDEQLLRIRRSLLVFLGLAG